jgi:hypothetical protein
VLMALDELYTRLIEQISELHTDDSEFCWLLLSMVTLAYRPLRLLELGVMSQLPDKILCGAERIQAIVRMCGLLAPRLQHAVPPSRRCRSPAGSFP